MPRQPFAVEERERTHGPQFTQENSQSHHSAPFSFCRSRMKSSMDGSCFGFVSDPNVVASFTTRSDTARKAVRSARCLPLALNGPSAINRSARYSHTHISANREGRECDGLPAFSPIVGLDPRVLDSKPPVHEV